MSSSRDSPSAADLQSRPSLMEASWVGSTAHSRLQGGEEGAIHGVFDGAINVLLERGLVCLVPEAVERGPLNLTLRLPVRGGRMSSLGVGAGDRVRVRDLTLELADRHLVSFGSAGIYSPDCKFGPQVLEDHEIAANLEVARKTALLSGNLGGLGGLLALLRPGAAVATTGSLNIFASAAVRRIARLEEAFRAEDEGLMKDAVTELVGLGPGLTPSSDDMLAGLVLVCVLHAENHGSPRKASRIVARVASANVRGRTTLLSEEYVVQAASGRGNERAMALCAALLTGGRKSVERETRRVLAIGETSGTDTVLGVLLGAALCAGVRSGLARRGSE